MFALVLSIALIPAQPDPVVAARDKAVKFLRDQQKADGSWESADGFFFDMDGGVTGMAALALLEAGVKPTDAAIVNAAAFLAKVTPKRTYVVSLRAQVLAKADAKKYAAEVQAAADWLAKTAQWGGDKLNGWGYGENAGSDNSNAHFAVAGLHAAATAGAKVDAKLWKGIRAMYLRTQTNGGWGYAAVGAGGPTKSMTTAGLFALTLAAAHDKGEAIDAEFGKGVRWLIDAKGGSGKMEGYVWFVTAELGRAAGKDTFKAGGDELAWYKDGAAKLVKEQKADGSWSPAANEGTRSAVLATAWGLYFLGPPK